MKKLVQIMKDWYSEMKERIRDDYTIHCYQTIKNMMRRLEEKNKSLDYCSDSGCLMIFTQKYSRLMDEYDRFQPLALSAMRRKSGRLMAKYV